MATIQLEQAIEGLRKLLSEKDEELAELAAEKIMKMTAELQRPDPTRPLPPPNTAWDVIAKGFMAFRTTQFEKYPEFYRHLAEGQSPKFLVFACSDSRVDPSFILNFLPGEAFLARNIANIVPPADQTKYNTSAGAVIEYATTALEVNNILVIGHSRCGGIKRLMTLPDGEKYDYIDDWVKIVTPAKTIVDQQHGHDLETLDQRVDACAKFAAQLSVKALTTYPFVSERLSRGTLKLTTGYYDFVCGTLTLWAGQDGCDDTIVIPPTHSAPPGLAPFNYTPLQFHPK